MTRKCHVRFVRELGSEMGPAYLPDRGDPQQHSRQEDRFPLLRFRIPEKYCYNGRAIGVATLSSSLTEPKEGHLKHKSIPRIVSTDESRKRSGVSE